MERSICWRQQLVSLGGDRAVNMYTFSKVKENGSSSIFRSRTPLSTFAEFRKEFELYPPIKLQWSFPPAASMSSPRNDDDLTTWTRLCESVGSSLADSESLSRLSLTLPTNDKGRPFALEFFNKTTLPHLKHLELADSFSCYENTLNAIADKLPRVEVLSLRNTGEAPVTHAVVKALARMIRSSPHIRQFFLCGLQFHCHGDWLLLLEALRDSTTLESVSTCRLSITDAGTNEDYFTNELAKYESKFRENKACTVYLESTVHLLAPHTAQQRLRALLHLRKVASLAIPTTQIAALASVADRIDFGYEFLRHQVDPTQWANLRQAAN